MSIIKRLMPILATIALVGSSMPSVYAQAEGQSINDTFLPMVALERTQAGSDAELVVTKTLTLAEQNEALSFWTRQALSAAQPMEMPAQASDAEVDTAALSAPEVLGPPIIVAPGLAADDADQTAREAYPLDWENLEAAVIGAEASTPTGTSGVYSSYVVNQVAAMQTQYPHRWIGRLSFSTPGGTRYCSGTSIAGNVMLTAAHCLYDTTNNRWYSSWVLAPAYRNGNAPYGTFAATQCWVLAAWVNLTGNYSINSWARHDVGVCRMGRNSANQLLNSAVGSMGRQANQPNIRHYHNLGYPFRNFNDALLPNAGLYLRTCVAESFLQTTETRGMGCNLGGGISGGPWMTGYAPGVVTGFADGVNSGGFIGVQNIYGARFNSNNIVPLCNSAGC